MAGFLMADDITVVETFTSADTLRGEESAKYAEFADLLMNQAVTGDDARRFIMAAVSELRTLWSLKSITVICTPGPLTQEQLEELAMLGRDGGLGVFR
jgi:hypothetical protein